MSKTINVSFMNENSIKVSSSQTLLELSKNYSSLLKHPILLAEVDNELRELHSTLSQDCSVKFLDITNANGFRTYQRSAMFLMICSAKDILGKLTRVVVDHSINKNIYCEFPDKNIQITEKILEDIENKMREYVSNQTPIEKISLPLETAISISKEEGLLDKVDILKYRRTSNVNFYKLGEHYNYFYGQMVINASYINNFKLVSTNKGFILQLASPEKPSVLLELKHLEKMTQVFNETSNWAKILRVRTVGELNNAICNGNLGEIIRISEALHEKKIAYISDMILEQNKSIILIAGPSSSGKTTFSERLCVQLRANGLRPHLISLDNYFLNREFVPIDEYGRPNFENLDFLDINQINIDLEKLLNGETVEIPNYNFNIGKREYLGNHKKLNEREVIILEGIHGLNDKLTENVPKDKKFKIFISALTQLNVDAHNRIPTSDTRLIRRIVRDAVYRNHNAQNTIDVWPNVLKGEVDNIFPFQENADAFFNSALVYEMCVLKQFVEPKLFGIDRNHKSFVEAKRLIKFLDSFLGVSSEQIPPNSILREFIGGSCFQD